jgi:hypothetical protein
VTPPLHPGEQIVDLALPLKNLIDAINRHDPAAIADCFTASYACETPLQPKANFTGNDRVRQNWTQMCADLPDIKAEVLRSTVTGAEIWSEWVMTGTRRDAGRKHSARGLSWADALLSAC